MNHGENVFRMLKNIFVTCNIKNVGFAEKIFNTMNFWTFFTQSSDFIVFTYKASNKVIIDLRKRK